MSEQDWWALMLRAFARANVEFLPYVPDGVLAPLLDEAGTRADFRLVPLTREEEGVGVMSGVYLGGRRGALLMQTSGMGNSLNVIGSLAIAQRIPLLMVVTERGGLGETVATQIPFGAALRRIMEAMRISVFEIARPPEVLETVVAAADMAYISRVPVVVLVKSIMSLELA